MENTTVVSNKLPGSQKIGYLFSGVGYVFCMMIPTFVIYFSTQSLGLAIGAVSAMMAIVKVLDAFTDVIAGIIIDRTKTKNGKVRPWIIRAAIPYAACLALLFSIPEGLGQIVSLVLIAVLYALTVSVFGTMLGVARYAIVPLMTSNAKERGSLGALGDGVGAFLCGAGFAVTFPLIGMIGWRTTFLIYAVIAFVACLLCFLLVRENLGEISEAVEADKKASTISFKDSFKAIFTNKYCLILFLVTMCQQITGGTFTTAGTYYFQYVVGDVSYYSKVMTIVMIGSLVAMIAMYFIAQKLSSKRIFLAGCIIAAIFDVIIIISGGRNVPVLMICMPLILIFGQVVLTSTFAPFAASAVDYSEARTGVRAEGVTSAVTNLGIKLGVALATVIFGSLAAAAGFVSAAETQTQQAINAIHNALLFVPLIALIIIALIVAIFYNIEKDITKAEAKRGTAS